MGGFDRGASNPNASTNDWGIACEHIPSVIRLLDGTRGELLPAEVNEMLDRADLFEIARNTAAMDQTERKRPSVQTSSSAPFSRW
jgi:hypothetical protein